MATSNKMILSTLGLVTIAFFAMILIVANILFTNSIERSKKRDTENADRLSASFNDSIDSVNRLLSLAQYSFEEFDYNDGMAHVSVGNILKQLLELNPTVYSAWFIAEPGIHHADRHCISEYLWYDGTIVANNTEMISENLKSPETAPWYYGPLTSGEAHLEMLNLYENGSGPVYSATIGVPILRDDEIIGVCGVNIIYKDILDMPSLQAERERVVMLISHDMTILHAFDQELIGKNLSDFEYEDLAGMRRSMERGVSYAKEIFGPISQERTFLYLQPLTFNFNQNYDPVYLYIGTPLNTLYEDTHEIELVLTIGGSICILLILAIIFLNIRRIIHPIRVLTKQAQQATEGDFDLEVFGSPDNDPDSKNEVAVLRRAFIKVLHALQENLHTVENRVQERTQELTKLNNYINILMESTTNVSILIDRDLRVLYCSKNFLQLMCINDFSEISGKPITGRFVDFPDPEYVKRTKSRIDRLLSGEKHFIEDDALFWPDGTNRLYRIMYNQVLDEKNNLVGMIIVMLDLTDVRQEEAQRRQDDLINSTNMPCMVWNDNGEIVAFNMEFVHAFNLPGHLSPYETEKVFSIIQPERQPDGQKSVDLRRQVVESAIANGFAQINVRLRRYDGTPAYYLINVARISWLSDHRLVVYCYDKTDLVQSEAEAKESQERERALMIQKESAQAAIETKNQFIANISHEIRTPMNAVLGMSELLLQEKLNNRQVGYAKDIKTSAEALLDIINDILDVSKIQSGKLSLAPVHYNFKVFIDHIKSIARFFVEDKDISFELQIEGEMPLCLYGDDNRLRQILINLLSNAVKFTNAGYVCLAIGVTDTSIHFTVSDTGIGIRTEDIEKIFEAFEQFDKQMNRNKCGTGLGLSITKALVDLMDGKIDVKSVYGQGTSFHVEIPKIPGDETAIRNTEDEKISLNAPDARILVVDDNKINLNVAIGLLGLCKITAETASSGQEAIELMKQKQYDVVFMDHMMPEMDGLETTKAIRDMDINTPIIALTANAVVGMKEIMLNVGMDDFLSKPIITSQLNLILAKWLPAEKQLRTSSENNDSVMDENNNSEEFWMNIEQIKAISISNGLDRVEGQRDIYEHLLRLMISETEKCAQKLKESLEAGDMHSLCIEVHSIKSSLASIGALELEKYAFELELASGRNDADYCTSHLPKLLDGLGDLHMKLKDAFSQIDPSEENADMPSKLAPILERMTEAFRDIDVVAIDDGVEQLTALSLTGELGEEIERITDAAIMMDFDCAVKIINNLTTAKRHG